jgi:hypothetical protein
MSEELNHARRRFLTAAAMTVAAAQLSVTGCAVLDKRRVYATPARLALNHWALSGDWTLGRQAVVLNEASGRIAYSFHARDLHLVMGPAARGTSVRFRVLIDGQPPGLLTGLTLTSKATARLPNSGCIG